ncbi:MAG: D-alanine--D-alanine ligase [Bacteroidales bacterium]|nr:D-alanine--D-alanine ligase [Bacteroidales bacterium]
MDPLHTGLLVGLTYDLRDEYLKEGYSHDETAEFDKEETIAGIEEALRHAGYLTERIGHVRNLTKRLTQGNRWDIVFNIAEGMYGLAREAQVPCLLDAFHIPYVFSDAVVLALALHKGLTKHIIRDAGIPTADFAEVRSTDDIAGIHIPFPLFVKPVAEGTGKGINEKSKVGSLFELKEACTSLLNTYNQPVLVERYLPGREFTVGIIGTGRDAQPSGIMEVCFKKKGAPAIYGLDVKENYQDYTSYTVPEPDITRRCYKVALDAWKILGCRDGGRVDLRLDERGIPNFIEVNPLAGLNYIHSDLPILSRLNGIEFDELIRRIMESALQRIPEYQHEENRHCL